MTDGRKTDRSIRANSVLPASTKQFRRLGALKHFYSCLWNDAFLSGIGGDVHLLRVYCALIVENALPHSTAIDCLYSLSTTESADVSTIDIPAQRQDHGSRRTWLALTSVVRLAVYCWKSTQALSEADRRIRPNRLLKRIESLVKAQFKMSVANIGLQNQLYYRDIHSLGIVMAIRHGTEPYMISALSGKVRPISQSLDDPYLITGVSQEPLSHFLMQHDGFSLRSEALRSSESANTDLLETVPTQWIADGKSLLRELCDELKRSIERHVDTPRKSSIANQILDKYADRATMLGPPDSAVALAIEYARLRFVDNPTITAGSLRDYLDRAVISGLLDSEHSYSLADWDPDDFVENLEDRLSSPRLSRRSKQIILDAYQPLLKFLSAELKLPPISISGAKQEFVGGSGQWRLISPHAIDKLIDSLYYDSRRALRQAAIVIALGYYCGLRGAEIKRLTLADVVFNDRLPDVDIELLRGKSRNARRRISLSKMAPDHTVELIRDAWSNRRSEFPKIRKLSGIALLGAENDTDGYQYGSLTRLTREVLKRAFGESANVHLLRHCFCSNLFLRWYALRNPDVLMKLRDRSHPLFQPLLQERLNAYFNCNPLGDGDVRPYDLVSLIKITGHASPETLFQYYIHSFSLVQAHAMSKIDSPMKNKRLDDRVIARLVPRMKSSASRARLKSRTIDGISSVVLH